MSRAEGGRLAGRTALITGASRGIGAAIARRFAAEGARVVIISRKQEAIEAAAQAIASESGGEVVGRVCHVGKAEQREALMAWMASDEGPGVPDVLVNNAGTNPYFGPMLDTTDAAWDKTLEINLKGAFSLIQAMARPLIAAGRSGSVINITSIQGMGASPLQGVYGMSKAAMISMTQTLAMELGRQGIRVNAIAPGLVQTRLAAALVESEELVKMYTERAALGRYGQPDEIAGLAVHLASDESAYMTGQVIRVDGGYALS